MQLTAALLVKQLSRNRTMRKGTKIPGVGGTPLCDLNGDVRPDRVWFSGCFVLKGVSIPSPSVLNRVSLHELMV